MEVGTIADFTHGHAVVGSWQRGVAEKGLMGGLRTMGRERLEITAFRSTACGFLECYARG
jgi:hypothetical protein